MNKVIQVMNLTAQFLGSPLLHFSFCFKLNLSGTLFILEYNLRINRRWSIEHFILRDVKSQACMRLCFLERAHSIG